MRLRKRRIRKRRKEADTKRKQFREGNRIKGPQQLVTSKYDSQIRHDLTTNSKNPSTPKLMTIVAKALGSDRIAGTCS